MHQSRSVLLATLIAFLLSVSLTGVHSQGLMGGFKGHHRGTGAVELLLATGILAKLLNHRAKHGPSHMGRHILHSLLGGARYPPRYSGHARYPMDFAAAHPALLQEDLMDPQASMGLPFSEDLMLNQESSLLGAKSPLLMGPSMPLVSDGQLLAEAQLSQQLLAARRARKLLEARKLLAAQEAKNMLAVQREAAHLLAAQEAAQAATLLSPARQLLSAASSPQHRIVTNHKQVNSNNNHAQQQAEMMNNMMNAERRMAMARSEQTQLIALPPGISEKEALQYIAQIQQQHGI